MQRFHPVIRLASFMVLTFFLALGGSAHIYIAAALLLALYVQVDRQAWRKAWRMLRRMRWLFLAIAVTYFWLTPGVPLINTTSAVAEWLPTMEGITQGGLRIFSLALMVVATSLLLHITSQEQMLGALRWLLSPLYFIGIPHESIAVRAALTIAAVPEVQERVRQVMDVAESRAQGLTRIGDVASRLFALVIREVGQVPCAPIALAEQRRPPLWQWVIPLSVVAMMMAGA